MISGFILIIIGVVFLLKSLGYISGSTWGIIWPAILIVIGIGVLLKRRDGGFFWEERFGWRREEIKGKE